MNRARSVQTNLAHDTVKPEPYGTALTFGADRKPTTLKGRSSERREGNRAEPPMRAKTTLTPLCPHE